MCFNPAHQFMLPALIDVSGEYYLFSFKSRSFVFYAQISTNPFFILIPHLQHKLPGGPFNIPGQRKRRTNRMHGLTMKTGKVIAAYNSAVCFFITRFKKLFHSIYYLRLACGPMVLYPAY